MDKSRIENAFLAIALLAHDQAVQLLATVVNLPFKLDGCANVNFGVQQALQGRSGKLWFANIEDKRNERIEPALCRRSMSTLAAAAQAKGDK
ncbi:MAG TPA: hypothetical protein DD666_13815 [Advenella kashmirensis]|uniref:Uncharacterized protein n=1 Tax=Advenella kashmirensis TaxID=310575 RepID=A0A356LHK4_9BURK|nr:hypothetical protein [Advenella kashmirensis]